MIVTLMETKDVNCTCYRVYDPVLSDAKFSINLTLQMAVTFSRGRRKYLNNQIRNSLDVFPCDDGGTFPADKNEVRDNDIDIRKDYIDRGTEDFTNLFLPDKGFKLHQKTFGNPLMPWNG